MTPSEIQDVRAAWAADQNIPWPHAKPPSMEYGDLVHAALHSRLLERGAWVEQQDGAFYVFHPSPDVPQAWRRVCDPRPSIISCMARAIVALAGEAQP